MKTTGSRSATTEDMNMAAAQAIACGCGLAPLTARILVARGITTVTAAQEFLTPSLERDWHDPAQIPGLAEVADKVEACVRAGRRILVFGDFDVDGITATTISVRGLRALGADCVGLIPHRYNEGYALSEAAIERAMQYDPALIMTVDCGISCGVEVAGLLARGVDVAITDHHEPGGSVPQGVPIADPKCHEGCPSRDLAGAGVALKLIQVLGSRFGQPDLWLEYTDFASLGTIADLMPLRSENRALVTHGLARMVNNPRMPILALATVCGVRPEEITSTKLSFSLIPRINAAGRMGDATIALDLMLSDEREQAEALAAQLEGINNRRREVEAELTEQVEAYLAENFHGEEVIVAGGVGWHEGVKGIVASRIARKYERPAIIFTIEEDGSARGSGRTYGTVNLFGLAGTCADLYDKFGGHAAALGITLAASKIDELRSRLCEAMSHVDASKLVTHEVDTAATLDECTVDIFTELERLQPFGSENKVPCLVVRNVFLEHAGPVGKTGAHLRFTASDGANTAAGIYFNAPNLEELAACRQPCDVFFEPTVDEWQGRCSAKLMTRGITMHAEPLFEPLPPDLEGYVAEVFAHADAICATGDYAGIERAVRFNTKVVGVTFENRQAVLESLEAGVELALVRQPENEVDANAIAVTTLHGAQLGYLNRHLAAHLAPVMDAGTRYDAAVSAVTGGPVTPGEPVRDPGRLGVRDPGVVNRSWGVNIMVRNVELDLRRCGQEDRGAEGRLDTLADARERWRAVPAPALDDALREALIGPHGLHRAQREALAHLAAGRSTLAIMATGRGKSLIFHLHAARCALTRDQVSVFMYPLRALVADQAWHLQEKFAQFGLCVAVLTGESDDDQRRRCFDGLAHGGVDVVLTTPEFFTIHAQRFAEGGRVGFVVVDEAHHIAQAKAGNRPAYTQLGAALETVGNPLVLAVTATAGDVACEQIRRVLPIEELVLDPTVRENLAIDDKRDLRNRASYIASLCAEGAKTVVYVNSREQTLTIARELRHRLPQLAGRIMPYNAGLDRETRKVVEGAFREGEFRVVVSTSAFGEGVDIPDIEHVVLYHLPFNEVEFNQMAGRAGRNGHAATVHLLYSYGDARINEKILTSSAPSRDALVALYKVLRELGHEAAAVGQDGFSATNSELAERANKLDRRAKVDDAAASCGIAVFRELGFLETSGHSVARRITMVEHPGHMDLESSSRYVEGKEEIAEFAAFKQRALGAPAQDLLEAFNRPILPAAALSSSAKGE